MCSRDFLRAKIEGRKLSMVTCYDYTFARLLSKSADRRNSGRRQRRHGDAWPSLHAVRERRVDAPSHRGGRARRRRQVRGRRHAVSVFPQRVGRGAGFGSVLMTAGAHAVKLEGVDGHEDVIQRLVAERHSGHGPSRAAASIRARLRRLSRAGSKRRRGARYRPPGRRAGRARRFRDRAGVRSRESRARDHRSASHSDHRHRRRRRMRRPDPGAAGSARPEHRIFTRSSPARFSTARAAFWTPSRTSTRPSRPALSRPTEESYS